MYLMLCKYIILLGQFCKSYNRNSLDFQILGVKSHKKWNECVNRPIRYSDIPYGLFILISDNYVVGASQPFIYFIKILVYVIQKTFHIQVIVVFDKVYSYHRIHSKLSPKVKISLGRWYIWSQARGDLFTSQKTDFKNDCNR